MSADGGNNVVSGILSGAVGVALSGVTVELRDAATGTVLSLTTTKSNGSFELYNTAAGNYELVARAQGYEARELIPAARMLTRIDLRMARSAGNAGGSEPVISLARLKVPGKARERYDKAMQAFLRGNVDQADKAVNQSLDIYPDNPEALTLRGMIALRQNNAAAAIEDFQKSIDVDPNYVPAYTSMSSTFNSQGKYDDAARTTERALAVNPNAWQGYFELSKSMLGKRMYDKALQMANRAEALAPGGIAVIHLLKAYALVPLTLYKDASTELQAFLSHAPKGQDTSEVKVLLAKVHAAETTAASNSEVTSGFALVSH